MKLLVLFCFFLFFLCYQAEAQTNAGIPDASIVLVVYNANSDTSELIKDYYVQARGIPNPLNVVPLNLPRKPISVGDWSDPHVVKLGYNDEYIQDSTLPSLKFRQASWAVWDSISINEKEFLI